MIPKNRQSLFRPAILINSQIVKQSAPKRNQTRNIQEEDTVLCEDDFSSRNEDAISLFSKEASLEESEESEPNIPALFKRTSSIEKLKDRLLG